MLGLLGACDLVILRFHSCYVTDRVPVRLKLSEMEAKFFSLRSETEGFVSLVSLRRGPADLKGQCHEIIFTRFFSSIISFLSY